MNIEDFNDIENFFNVYKARHIELKLILKNMANRKVLIMHIGGVVIECLLKHRVVKEKNITKSRYKVWLDDDSVSKLIKMGNGATNKVVEGNGTVNPGHNLVAIAKLDNELNLIVSPNEQLERDLKFIYNPLGINNKCFIDLRYVYDMDIDNLDEIFERWNKCFERAHNIIFK